MLKIGCCRDKPTHLVSEILSVVAVVRVKENSFSRHSLAGEKDLSEQRAYLICLCNPQILCLAPSRYSFVLNG